MQKINLIQKEKIDKKEILRKFQPLKVGEKITGRVVAKEKNALYVDLDIYGVAIVFGQEFINARDLIKNLKIGDEVTGRIVEIENDDGYIELSLAQNKEEMIWNDLKQKMIDKQVVNIKIIQVNKGGLMGQISGKVGFLPVSQLTNEHYPRVEAGDKNQILLELKKFVGQTLKVIILDLDPKEEKIIFSEKEVYDKEIEKTLRNYKVGDIVDCEVRGVADFGIFVKFLNASKDQPLIEGLVHISELGWQLIDDPHKFFKVGDKVKAQIISIDKGRISLSIKRLKPNPWDSVDKKYKKGQIVTGTVTKFNPFGVFVKIEEGIQGLAHVVEFGSKEKMKEKLELNKKYKFKILQIEPKEFKMVLKLIEDNKDKS